VLFGTVLNNFKILQNIL